MRIKYRYRIFINDIILIDARKRNAVYLVGVVSFIFASCIVTVHHYIS